MSFPETGAPARDESEHVMGKAEDSPELGTQAKQMLRQRAQRLMQEAAGLEALAQSLPERLHPQADNALYQMAMKAGRGL